MHTLGTAAKATGKSKSTILRAIRDGKLSASKNVHGVYQIEPAELHRVYPAQVAQRSNDTLRTPLKNTDETGVLQAELDAARQLAAERQKTIDDLRTRLDQESEERRKLTAMLTDQRMRRKGFWARLVGAYC